MPSVPCGFGFQTYCVRLASSSISSFLLLHSWSSKSSYFGMAANIKMMKVLKKKHFEVHHTCCNLHPCLLMDRDYTSACIIHLMHVYNTFNHILFPLYLLSHHPNLTDSLHCANKFLALPSCLDFIEILNVRKNIIYITILLNVHICWMNEFCGYIPL